MLRCNVLDLAKPGLAATLAQEQQDDQLNHSKLSDQDAAHEFQRVTGEHKTTFTKEHIAATAHSLFDGLTIDQGTDRIELANELTNSMTDQFVEITPDIYQVPDQFAHDNRFTIEDVTGQRHSILDMKRVKTLCDPNAYGRGKATHRYHGWPARHQLYQQGPSYCSA